MKPASAPAALRVQELLGPDYSVVEFDASSRSSAEAAAAIGYPIICLMVLKPTLVRDRGPRSEKWSALNYVF